MPSPLDCLIIGSCVVDVLCRPIDLSKPIGPHKLYPAEPMVLTSGGITMNTGVGMARLGMKVGVFSYVGNDSWAPVVHGILREEGMNNELLLTHPTGATSTTVVAIDPSGERSFFHCVGAPKLLDAAAIEAKLDAFRHVKYALFGYYSLMPNLEPDLPDLFAKIRALGCKTAMDTAGSGGTMKPLDRILPHLDVYVPSLGEAKNQTGQDDPKAIVKTYRDCGAPGVLGVKLGSKGALLSPRAGEFIQVPVAQLPGPLVDTTGAGDNFYAGLLTGLIKGLPLEQAGRLGSAAAACSCTAVGGSTGGRDYAFTAKLAGIS